MSKTAENQIIITGPCAVESWKQISESAKLVKNLDVPLNTRKELRAMIFKPRTTVGWDGVGQDGLPWLVAVSSALPIATEILLPEQAQNLTTDIFSLNHRAEIRLWLGARNYNHLVQEAVGQLAANYPHRISVLLKNPMYEDEIAWLGAVEHVLRFGMPHENLVLCHRGHHPNGHPNPLKLRNVPNHKYAMAIKEKTGLKMLFDPSHTAGRGVLVSTMLQEARDFPYDGLCIEAHPHPEDAKTDKDQQLSLLFLATTLDKFWFNKHDKN